MYFNNKLEIPLQETMRAHADLMNEIKWETR